MLWQIYVLLGKVVFAFNAAFFLHHMWRLDPILHHLLVGLRRRPNSRFCSPWRYIRHCVRCRTLFWQEPPILTNAPSTFRCLAINPTTRIIGAISLWSVEIIMQLRIYALFQSSKKVMCCAESIPLVCCMGY